MKVAINQPYYFPYIGYWQLINAVEIFVVYDDVNFIKKGWINRNKILINHQPAYTNILLEKASQNKKINEIKICEEEKDIDSKLKILRYNYGKAPYFDEVYPFLESIIRYQENSLSKFLYNQLKSICEYLDIKAKLVYSSDIEKDIHLKGQEKIIDICKKLNATDYYNAIGGQDLYSREDFAKENLSLYFIKTRPIEYKQFNKLIHPNLSIIDVMMFNSKEDIKKFLLMYDEC